MSGFFTSIAAFIFAIGVLIAFHEFGHFWVARRCGVKVLRYSIGFGKPLWIKRSGVDNTEFIVAAVPLGGYVKMLDEREGEVEQSEVHRAFNRQSVSKRIAIVAAGPIFNFIFAIAAYFVMYLIGVPGIKPIVGSVIENSPAAQAGIHVQDTIIAVEGEETLTWSTARIALLQAALDKDKINITVQDTSRVNHEVTLDVQPISTELRQSSLLQEIGIAIYRPPIPPIVGKLESGGAAQRDGIQAGDRVLTVNGEPISDWEDWVKVVRDSPEKTMQVEIERQGKSEIINLTPKRIDFENGSIGRIGAMPQAVSFPDDLRAIVQYGPVRSITTAVVKTWEMSVLTLKMIGKMLIGEVSVKNLSGPITIAAYAGYTASEGVTTFLSFLAIVSISLGVLNLLPIPLLDGGHLLLYVIEIVKGKALSENTQLHMQRVGIVLLGMLMVLAFYNDIHRIFLN